MSEHIISVTDLYFRQPDRVIFSGISFKVKPGAITVVMGPSGTGKTTLLRLLTGQWKPESGEIEVLGHIVNKSKRRELKALRKQVGILFQQGGLFSDLNVYDNIAFPLRQHTDLTETMIRDLVLLMLQAVGLRGAAGLQVEQLSGGMARRAVLARAIVMSPRLILYDEPFAGQDPITRGVLVQLIKELNEALGVTSVVVSHNVIEAFNIADQIMIIVDGKLIAEGAPDEVAEMEDLHVQQFLQGFPDGPISFQQADVSLAAELKL